MVSLNYARKMENTPVLYSLCSGYNFYIQSHHQKYEIFGKSKNVVQHIKTGELFYVTEFPEKLIKKFTLNYWIGLIRKPVDLKHFIWPVDIIQIDDDKYALVFPLRALPVFDNFTQVLSNDLQLGWNMPWVKQLTSNFLRALSNFSAQKYAYHEFSDSNMFFRKDNYEVMFDFSFSTQRIKSLFDSQYVDPKRITPDYADSYYYSEHRHNLMDLASDYYSVAVILFKLLVGRLPYQGTVMEPEPNSTAQEHSNWLKVYHNNTYFIFDERDETNHIGGETGFAKDEIFVERWEALPTHVRNMFHNVFQNANVLRSANDLIFYTPQQWYSALFEDWSSVELVYRTADAAKPSVSKKEETPKAENANDSPNTQRQEVTVSAEKSIAKKNHTNTFEP